MQLQWRQVPGGGFRVPDSVSVTIVSDTWENGARGLHARQLFLNRENQLLVPKLLLLFHIRPFTVSEVVHKITTKKIVHII